MQQSPIKNEDEFGRLLATDARFFLETLTDIKDLAGQGIVPFALNAPQVDYFDRVWCVEQIGRDIVGKSRKWGFSTFRIGLGLHKALYTTGHIFRIIAHRDSTSRELNRTVKLLYRGARKSLEQLGLDPNHYLARLKIDNVKEYTFPDLESAVLVDTARGRGVGQSDRTDDLYITEYSEWDNALEKRAALIGSLPPGGTVTIDFNAKGIGNDAYDMYQAAKLEGESGWNGYKALFYGVPQCPDIYTDAQLEQAKRELGPRYCAVYPANDDEMFLRDEQAVHDWLDILECKSDSYLSDTITPKQIKKYEVYHGIDTAPKGEPGGNWQIMKSRAFVDGTLREIEAPIRERMPEHAFTELCHKRWEKYGGLMTVERNVAQAVLLRLAQLGTPRGCTLFRGKPDPTNPTKSRVGFSTTWASKKTAIADYDELLRNREIDLPSPNHVNELRQFEWKEGSRLAGAPDANNKYDDEVMADYMLVQGMRRTPKPGRIIQGKRY